MSIASEISPCFFLNDRLHQSDLNASRMCINGRRVLAYMKKHGGIQLTKSRAFYRKFVVWAVDEFQWPAYKPEELYAINKVLNEDDVLPLSMMHYLLLDARLIRHAKDKAVLTKAGEKILHHHGRLQAVMFETFFTNFDFARHERWPIEYEDADSFHFIGVIRNRLSEWVAYRQFVEWCIPIHAMPSMRGTPLEDACFYLYTRLMRPMIWLGLVEEQDAPRYSPIEQRLFRKTPLFDTFLRFELDLRHGGTVH